MAVLTVAEHWKCSLCGARGAGGFSFLQAHLLDVHGVVA